MCATSIYVALLPWQCHDFEVISFSFHSYLFTCPWRSDVNILSVWIKGNDDDKRIRKGDTLVSIPSTILNLSKNSASLSIIPKPVRSFWKGDKAGQTSISLKLIWCQSLFICCLLKIVELIEGDVSFLWGEKQRKEVRKRGVILSAIFSLFHLQI